MKKEIDVFLTDNSKLSLPIYPLNHPKFPYISL